MPAAPLPTGVSGEIHSWRIDPHLWPRVLDAVASLGIGTVSAYVPWSEYELSPGRFDFTGPRDIERFCALASDRGLGVIVRIGPDSGAELATSGWPRWVVDDPASQARRPDGTPYLLVSATHHFFPPSYASPLVWDAVARWYDEVVPRLAALQAPGGPVVACQVDNEIGYHFQPHPYALDYHPAALSAYRDWLLESYGSLGAVNAAYDTRHASPDDIDPPTDGTDTPELRRIDWVTWKEEHLRRTLARFAGMARERGMDRVPIIHNDYPRTQTPIDTGALDASGTVDAACGDVYTTKEGGRFARDYVRHLCGSTRHPWLLEVGAGWLTLPWLLPVGVTPADAEFVSLRTLAAGARAMNVFMLVERDRWYGSPISRAGERREPFASFYRRLTDLIAELDLFSLRREAPALLIENRAEGRRVAAREVLGETVPCFAQLYPLDRRLASPDDPEADEIARWERGLASVLDDAGIDYDRASSSALPDLSRYETVLMPVLDVADATAWTRLREASEVGVRVGVGPRPPRIDERLRRTTFQNGRIALLDEPSDAVALLGSPAFSSTDLDLHRWIGDGREVLFAFNQSGEAVTSKVTFSGAARFEGRWEPGTLSGDGTVDVSLPAWGVQVWEVTR